MQIHNYAKSAWSSKIAITFEPMKEFYKFCWDLVWPKPEPYLLLFGLGGPVKAAEEEEDGPSQLINELQLFFFYSYRYLADPAKPEPALQTLLWLYHWLWVIFQENLWNIDAPKW